MNWHSIKHLTEDDYGKPLLLKYHTMWGICYKTVVVSHEGHIHTLEPLGKGQRIILEKPDMSETYYLRIDEIKG